MTVNTLEKDLFGDPVTEITSKLPWIREGLSKKKYLRLKFNVRKADSKSESCAVCSYGFEKWAGSFHGIKCDLMGHGESCPDLSERWTCDKWKKKK